MSKDLINGEASIPCSWHGMEVTLEGGLAGDVMPRGGGGDVARGGGPTLPAGARQCPRWGRHCTVGQNGLLSVTVD